MGEKDNNPIKKLMRNKYIEINGIKMRLRFFEDLDEGVYRLTVWEA